MIIRCVVFISLLLSTVAFAEPLGMAKIADTSSVWRLFLALGFLVALIPLVIWGLKRLQGLQHKLSKSEIRVIATHPIGTKERLLLIEVDGKRLLIGATAQQITCLKELGRTEADFADILSEQISDEK
ncbi:flagellar biosynthetic protein FliO [Marinomonas piezotolerans]|uniref:Flagellar protein n=1 Tax=Marinomonas piezotolerans TaxID=2213058 RepID=A0A370U7F1_9GAMM|nr:flagellar biosynthetic protein FliO [Marinomonas piezotolerans]RDL43648.1 flagellar biosynthetic protein FliO [Marinomonas piezotolerans]